MDCWPRSITLFGTTLAAVVRCPVINTVSPAWHPSRVISTGSRRATPRPTWKPSITTSCNSLSWFELGFALASLAGLLSPAPFSRGNLPVTALAVSALSVLDAPRTSSICFPLPYKSICDEKSMLLLPYHMYVRAGEKLKHGKPEGDRRGREIPAVAFRLKYPAKEGRCD